MTAHLLIVEDDLTFSVMMQTWLRKKGFDVDKVSSVNAAIKQILNTDNDYDLILSDLRLPDEDGLYLLAWLRKKNRDIPFIIMTNYAEVQNAVLAMKSGAADYIAKPVQPDILLQKIKDAISCHTVSDTIPSLATSNNTTQKTESVKTKYPNTPKYIEGKSEASRQLYEYVSLVAPTPMSVLILGASGTGKEYVARRIHELSPRKNKPFIAIDCGAIPKDVAASEFFGYKKGAFTGADSDKKGAFEMANGGTLFLDEMGNLSYDIQVQLLRALQERRIRPLGSAKETEVDIRLVCATNENLAQRVDEGKFREDLYHRINEFTIYMPCLKDRDADLFLFADLFIRHANEELDRQIIGLDDKASELLARYDWPGNLRELNNVIKRAVLMAKGKYITTKEINLSILPSQQETLTLHDKETEQQRIRKALQTTGGNKTKTAKLLAIDRKTLYNKMQKYGIEG